MFLNFLFKKNLKNKTISAVTRDKVSEDWKNVEMLLSQKSPSQLKQALILADRSLDNVLKDVVAGNSMGERLKNAQNMFDRDTYNKIWEAHKVRNSLVHESGFEPPYFVIRQSVESLKKGLQAIGINL
ncbi:MAG TPA: hypothetical protein PKH50_01845 [bacterium]|jgi:hypothetical protein|nr:hypothetical protein [bacterium]